MSGKGVMLPAPVRTPFLTPFTRLGGGVCLALGQYRSGLLSNSWQ